MSYTTPTVRIVDEDAPQGFRLINRADFDEAKHTRVDDVSLDEVEPTGDGPTTTATHGEETAPTEAAEDVPNWARGPIGEDNVAAVLAHLLGPQLERRPITVPWRMAEPVARERFRAAGGAALGEDGYDHAAFARTYSVVTRELADAEWQRLRRALPGGYASLYGLRDALRRRHDAAREQEVASRRVAEAIDKVLGYALTEMKAYADARSLTLREAPPDLDDSYWSKAKAVMDHPDAEPPESPPAYIFKGPAGGQVADVPPTGTDLDWRLEELGNDAPREFTFASSWTWQEVEDRLRAQRLPRRELWDRAAIVSAVLRFRLNVLDEALRQVEVVGALDKAAPVEKVGAVGPSLDALHDDTAMRGEFVLLVNSLVEAEIGLTKKKASERVANLFGEWYPEKWEARPGTQAGWLRGEAYMREPSEDRQRELSSLVPDLRRNRAGVAPGEG